MSPHCAPRDSRKVAANCDGGRSFFLAGIAVIALIPASEATADQATELALRPGRNGLPAGMYGRWDFSLPASPASDTASLAQSGAPSSAEFRPRPRSALEPDLDAARPGEDLEFDKTVWQRLYEYRSRDRVRVLTLWESAASAVSLQTDRKGGPSLQWTSRWMNRGGATRGVLDRWLPASIRGLSHAARASP